MNQSRVERVLAAMEENGLKQILLVDPMSIYYLTDIYMAPLERFYALCLRTDGNHAYFLKHLFHVPDEIGIQKVWYSDTDPVMELVAAHLDSQSVLGVDKDLKARIFAAIDGTEGSSPVSSMRRIFWMQLVE